MAVDKEYHRVWRQRQKDIASGKLVVEDKPKLTHAEHSRLYRERLKKKKEASIVTKNKVRENRALSDKALEAVILRRGKILSNMMDTPVCMWPANWLEED